jgi:hypothetical protein
MSCSWDFLTQDSESTTSDTLKALTTSFPGGYRVSYSNSSDVLQYYEDFFYASGSSELVDQMQHHAADSTLGYSHAYQFNDSGDPTLDARFDGSSALSCFNVTDYDSSKNVISVRAYNAHSSLVSAYKYDFLTATADALVSKWGTFDADQAISSMTVNTYYDYDPSKLFYEKSYVAATLITPSASVVVGRKSLVSSLARAVTDPNRLSLSLPTPPTSPTMTFTTDGLSVSGYKLYEYDDCGSSVVNLDSNYYPTNFLRKGDTRVSKDINVALTWDSAKRIAEKLTSFGATTALDVKITYENATSFFPVKIATTGASLLVPLTYDITYEDGTSHWPKRVSVSSNDGSLLQYFEYEYTGSDYTVLYNDAKSLDPFKFFDDVIKSVVKIKHYDGDGKLVENFVFSADTANNGLRVDVTTPDGQANGHYFLGYDTAGNVASLAGYSVDGTQTFAYTYDCNAAISEITKQKARYIEYLPANATSIATNFLYDLLM